MDNGFYTFRGDKLPTNGEVLEFIISRTKHGKASQNTTLNVVSSEIHDIWTKADVCPLSPNVPRSCERFIPVP